MISDCSRRCIPRGRRLKPDPVPEEILTKILDAAIRAPSAGNSQHSVFVVVRDPELRRELGLLYRKASDIAKAIYQARARPVHMTETQYQRMMSSGLPRVWPWHTDHHQSHSVRGRNQNPVGNSGRRIDLCLDAHRLLPRTSWARSAAGR